MDKNEYSINLETNRLIKKNTPKYKRLLKLGKIKQIDKNEETEHPVSPKVVEQVKKEVKEPKKVEKVEKVQDDFSEEKLQKLLVSKSTDIISQNMDKFMDTHKLTDEQVDIMVRKLLYEKLMGQTSKKEPKKEKTKTKKSKYKLRKVESSESEEESD